MTDGLYIVTDRFFGGVDRHLENLRAMLRFVGESTPTRDELREWLRENTAAESETTIERYVSFQRSIGLLDRRDDEYQLTDHGAEYVASSESRLVFEDQIISNRSASPPSS